jgi:ectoine hydroxylase-related dioxygenase (phytanoyl-CoA dioxygenase family)
MNDTEKFLFDLQGYIVVPGLLSPDEVSALNDAFDANWDQRRDDDNRDPSGNMAGSDRRGMFTGMLTWEQPHCRPFRDLLAHPKLLLYLDTLHGRGWKLDHEPFMLTGGKGIEGLRIHGTTNVLYNGSRFYAYTNGQMRVGLLVVQYALHDQNPGDGGLCVIAGSHKANFDCPREITTWEEHQEVVYQVPMKAGDMVIFSENTLHGSLPWQADHERRALLYRYTPKYLHYDGGTYEVTQPEWVAELTEAQQAVLEPPYIYHHPLIEPDGETVVRPRRED